MRIPLQFQIMTPLAAVALFSLLAVGLINAKLVTNETESTIERQLQGVVSVLASSNFPLTDAVLRQMRGLSGAEFVLVDDAGRQVSASLAGVGDELPTTNVIETGGEVLLGPQVKVAEKSFFHSAIRLPRPLGTSETGVLHMLFPRQQYDAVWRGAFLPPLVIGAATIVAVALVTQWIASRLSRELGTLGAGVRRLAGGEFTALELPTRDDEVRDVAVAVNQTAERLREYEQHVRQTEQVRTVAMLGAGLAHEMRNAATGCRLAVDLHAENCLAPEEDDSLAVAKSQLELMESRLQSFLRLGRAKEESVREQIELAELVNDVLPLVSPAAKHAGVTIDWHGHQSPLSVLADCDALRMVLINLLLNAVEAVQKSPVPDNVEPTVWISVREEVPGFVDLLVIDSGPGPDDSVAEKLFKPFVSTKSEGVGLGLATASEVAQAQGGELSWSRQDGRTCFALRLPLVADTLSLDRNREYVEDSCSR